MERLHWEFSVLSRAVAFGNLSGASAHVGLSQPQLSRIVSRLEGELKTVLLDRTARRKSAWTPVALKIAETFSHSMHKLDSELARVLKSSEPTTLRCATLEGLIPVAMELGAYFLGSTTIKTLILDNHDLNRLEELFLAGELDLILSGREPGRRKYRHVHRLGHQSMALLNPGHSTLVLSQFQHGTRTHEREAEGAAKVVVSNSLQIRRGWIERWGGKGTIPSALMPGATTKETHDVILVGADHLTPALWSRVTGFKPSTAKKRA